MKHRKILIAAVLIVILAVSFFLASDLLAPAKQTVGPSKPFYVGIETGWNATVADCEALIDQVKDYTNMYIIASPQVIKNETELNEVCDYAYAAGLYFMPEFYEQFFLNDTGYIPSEWFNAAQERYGNHLLGVYYYDEPAGSQLDTTQIIKNNPVITPRCQMAGRMTKGFVRTNSPAVMVISNPNMLKAMVCVIQTMLYISKSN